MGVSFGLSVRYGQLRAFKVVYQSKGQIRILYTFSRINVWYTKQYCGGIVSGTIQVIRYPFLTVFRPPTPSVMQSSYFALFRIM